MVAGPETGQAVSPVEAEEQSAAADEAAVVDASTAPGPAAQAVATAAATPTRKRWRGRSPWALAAAALAAVAALLALWFLLYAFVLTGLEEHANQARLYDRLRLELANATAPLGGVIKAGSPVALISAPAGGLHDAVVVEGTTAGVLQAGPGHLADTPLPGQAGISVLLGRSVTFGAPFGDVTKMKAGDKITVSTGQGVFSYEVYDVWRPGQAQPRPIKSNQSGIALVTSASGGWRSGWAPSHSVYVDGLLVHGSVQPAPPGRPATVGQASLPMHGDSKALLPFIFWLEALLVVVAAIVFSWVRWGKLQTWVVGVPVMLGVLWGLSGSLTQFLPNLL
jgi:sortase A